MASETSPNRGLRIILHPLRFALAEVHDFEQFYIKLHNIYALVSQMFFFLACALVTGEYTEEGRKEDFILGGLKTLLFYSVIAYFTTKTRDIVTTGRPSLFQNWNFTEGFCRIVIEWAKAIVVVICLREQGIHFQPSALYGSLTFLYYVCTERIFCDIALKIVQSLSLEWFDDLEHLYTPLALNAVTIALGVGVEAVLLATQPLVVFAPVCFFFTVYIRSKDAYYNSWKIIRVAREAFDNFRSASTKDLEDFDDVCAVCLNRMSRAKITPCNHFFHPNCLKEWLKNSLLCPICKLNFE